MANWRREDQGTSVHVIVETAAVALCELGRDRLGPTIWDAGIAAPDLCVTCSRKTLDATNQAVRLTERVASDAELEAAKDSLRALLRLVPEGVTRDLIVYARACIVRGDKKGAHESVRTWRANMRALGVFGQDD